VKPSVLLDVSAGAVAFGTGIQRVVRDMVGAWPRAEVELVVWDEGLDTYRPPSAVEFLRLGVVDQPSSELHTQRSAPSQQHSWFLVPDFVHQFSRREAIRATVEAQELNLSYFVHDCVPVTTPETTIKEMTPAFSEYVLDLARADLVLTNSISTAEELKATWEVAELFGKAPPSVISVGLPNELPKPQAGHRDSDKEDLKVLWVGSSEPRKNLGGVLFASERLWSQGLIFKLVLVGNRSWSDQDEQNYLNSLVRRGRDIERHFEVSDSELVDFYRTSDVLVFPSLHEGFGLPIIEALSHGLPVITSEFGSMGQLACHGGCITVDPNDDQAFELSLKNVLTDSSLRKSLMNQASTTSHLTSHDFVNRIREGLQLKT